MPPTSYELQRCAGTCGQNHGHTGVALGIRKAKPRPSRTAGRIGEEAAVCYLQKQGYQILVRNFRKAFAEVDIIARQGETLVFIEVKARTSLRFGVPAEAVHADKQRRLSKIALNYMMQEGLGNCSARFDVVSVLLNHNGVVERIELFENAFDYLT
ncbi:MAG: YraN family protein [Desulfobulbus sp.]